MTRLLQMMAGAPHGGAEAFFTRLALALQRAGQVQKLAIRRDPVRAVALRSGGADVVELGYGGRIDLWTRHRLRALCREWQPRVVLGWMSRAASMMPGGPFVRVARLGGYYDLKYYRRAHHLIGNTRDIVSYLVRSGWPADRAHYLPNFVDAELAAPVPRALLGTPEDVPLLLALGRLHPNKGFDVLLEALSRVPRAHLWLAGDGPLAQSLKKLAAETGVADRVRFLGWRDDTAALLAAADLVVCPSRREPLGNVVIEAWAHGVPVVATLSEGPRALVTSGENGWLVPIEDSEALACAIREALTADRNAVAAAGRASYEREFTEAAVVAAYQDFFDRVAT